MTSGRTTRPGGDTTALATLVAIILVAVGFRFAYDNWLAGFDLLDFFLPNYGYVGDRIRSFEVPAWNPYFSSGTPMAGDAGGGWMYLPVMLAFSLFDVDIGIKVMVLLQSLIGGTATYMLGRRLGLFPMAALFSATTFASGPALYGATGQSTVIGQISAFVPVGLVGAECAVRADRWSSRLAWCGLAAVAIAQMFAAWPQGFMYGATLIASWFVYRCLCAPTTEIGSRAVHVTRTLISGIATAALAAAFGAAAILPRLDFSAQSTIPGGDYSGVIGGDYVAAPLSRIQILGLFIQNSVYWRIVEHNSAILILALLAVLLGRARFGAPFFAVSSLVFIDLAVTGSVTRVAFSVLPLFERVHGHRPTATMYMVFLPVAMLAGAGVQILLSRQTERSAWLGKLLPLPVLLLVMLAVERAGDPVGWPQAWIAVAATVLILVPDSRLPAAWHRAQDWLPRIAVSGLMVVSLVYPSGADFVYTMGHPHGLAELSSLLPKAVDTMQLPEDRPEVSSNMGKDEPIQKVIQTVLARHDPGTAAQRLQELRSSQPPFRYAAYFGTGSGNAYVPSTAFRLEPRIVAILAGERSARLGLEQISGYNPLHLKYYVEYIEAMNRARQDYHWLDVYTTAISRSQLLDMLNVRFVLVPAGLPHTAPIAYYGTEVYRDDLVVVYENPYAFPRAWLVHDVRPNNDGQGLALLAEGSIDGRSVAFVDGPAPPVTSISAPSGRPNSIPDEHVVVASNLPEMMTIRSTSVADGLLVVSESYANGWNAYVDGQQAKIVRTNHALQGVPLAAGDHTVVLKYEPASLAVGLWVTGGTFLMLASLWFWALAKWLCDRKRRQGVTPLGTADAEPNAWSEAVPVRETCARASDAKRSRES